MHDEGLENVWQAYKEAVRAGGNPQTLYQEQVWPALLDLWRRQPRVYPSRQPFAVSVHTLGTSPEATALAILGTGAETVYVIHTRDSASFLERLRRDTGKDLYPLEVGKSDVAAIYRHVKDLLERHPHVPVALDLTSGTKAMSAGLAAAGFFFQRFFPQVRVVYVDNEAYDPELRRPRAGTERLVILPNPHEVLGGVDAFLARELYERGEFAKAQAYFGRLVESTGDRQYELYALLSGMYRAWQALDFSEALKQGKKLLDRLSQDVWLNHPLNRARGDLEAQVALLEGVERFLRTRDFGEQGVLGLAATLLRLSERARGENPPLAALYAYRALELLLQERLSRLGRRAEAPGLTPEEAQGLREVLAGFLQIPPEAVEVPPKLGLLHLVAFLRLKGDSLLAALPQERLMGLSGVLKARNESLLVHGFLVPREKELQSLLSLAQRLGEDLAAGARPSLEPVPLGF